MLRQVRGQACGARVASTDAHQAGQASARLGQGFVREAFPPRFLRSPAPPRRVQEANETRRLAVHVRGRGSRRGDHAALARQLLARHILSRRDGGLPRPARPTRGNRRPPDGRSGPTCHPPAPPWCYCCVRCTSLLGLDRRCLRASFASRMRGVRCAGCPARAAAATLLMRCSRSAAATRAASGGHGCEACCRSSEYSRRRESCSSSASTMRVRSSANHPRLSRTRTRDLCRPRQEYIAYDVDEE